MRREEQDCVKTGARRRKPTRWKCGYCPVCGAIDPDLNPETIMLKPADLSRIAGLILVLVTFSSSAPAHAGVSAQQAALTRPTPETTAFIYVDYVTGLDNLMNTIPAPQYRNNIAAFAEMAPLFKADHAVIGEETDYYGVFLPEIKSLAAAGAPRFPRTRVSGYTKELAAWLKGTGKKNVVIGGISIDNCTLHTSLDLLRAGYTVFVVVDASSTNSRLAEDAALLRLSQAGAVTVGWLSIMTELGDDFASPYGEGMAAIVREHWPASTVGPVNDTTPDGRGLQPLSAQ